MNHKNQPATASRDKDNWPWKYILKHSRDDFIVVKMDIDHAEIENPLAEQLMNDPELYERVPGRDRARSAR